MFSKFPAVDFKEKVSARDLLFLLSRQRVAVCGDERVAFVSSSSPTV